jgi:hypothetical protein
MNNISFSDLNITCVDCEKTFVFSSGEQAFYKSKALSPPKRCPRCRKQRKLTIVPDINISHYQNFLHQMPTEGQNERHDHS